MKKRNVKLAFVALVLLFCLLLSFVVLAACNNDTGNNDTGNDAFRSDYAAAQTSWYAAPNKVVRDNAVISGVLGSETTSSVTLTLDGYRAYIGEEWKMHYDLSVKGLKGILQAGLENVLAALKIGLDISKDENGNISVAISLNDNVLTSLSTTEAAIRDYVKVFDFDDNMFYDAGNITGKENAFTIGGEDSLGYILWQIAPVISKNFGFDFLPMLEKWLKLGEVSGTVTYDKDGDFASMITSQDIEAFIPDEDALFLAYNVDNFPDIIIDLFETKRLSFSLSGITIALNFSKVFAEGISLNANVGTSAKYALLPADATFEDAEEIALGMSFEE